MPVIILCSREIHCPHVPAPPCRHSECSVGAWYLELTQMASAVGFCQWEGLRSRLLRIVLLMNHAILVYRQGTMQCRSRTGPRIVLASPSRRPVPENKLQDRLGTHKGSHSPLYPPVTVSRSTWGSHADMLLLIVRPALSRPLWTTLRNRDCSSPIPKESALCNCNSVREGTGGCVTSETTRRCRTPAGRTT